MILSTICLFFGVAVTDIQFQFVHACITADLWPSNSLQLSGVRNDDFIAVFWRLIHILGSLKMGIISGLDYVKLENKNTFVHNELAKFWKIG